MSSLPNPLTSDASWFEAAEAHESVSAYVDTPLYPLNPLCVPQPGAPSPARLRPGQRAVVCLAGLQFSTSRCGRVAPRLPRFGAARARDASL
jgi:hypothetical protein